MNIDHIYCINLEKRPDKKELVQKEFEREGLNVEIFKGTDGSRDAPPDIQVSTGEWGCADSHINVWKDIVYHNYSTALIFEDDAKLIPNFKNELAQLMTEFPSEWDYINLGSGEFFTNKTRQVSPNLFEGTSLTTHCYLISIQGALKLYQWDSKNAKYTLDFIITKIPLKQFYTKKLYAIQNIAEQHPIVGLTYSMVNGDIGSIFSRNIDLDYIIKTSLASKEIMIPFVLAIISFIYILT